MSRHKEGSNGRLGSSTAHPNTPEAQGVDSPLGGSTIFINESPFPSGTSHTRMAKTPRSKPLYTRSISSPLTPGKRAMSAGLHATSSTFKRNPPPEPRWTLFNQLMEDGVQISSSPPQDPVAICGRPEVWQPPAHIDVAKAPKYNRSPDARHSDGETEGGSARGSQTSTGTITHREGELDHQDSESDPSPSESEESSPLVSPRSSSFSLSGIPTVPLLYRNILKCSIAYFIASLFTFSPYLSRLIGDISSNGRGTHTPSPSGHMVASIAVYFNPAKTMGGMIEADVFCVAGLLYASVMCLASMHLFWWLELSPGWEWLGDLVAIIWLGVGMSFVAWSKVWMANPSFNTACSMMAIIMFVVIVKEGGWDMLVQVATIIIYGSAISNLVCYLIWPQSSIVGLQKNMTKTLDSFSTILGMLTETFLLEGGAHSKSQREKMQKAVENHQSSFTSLKKSLSEARTEWIRRDTEEGLLGSWTETGGKQAYMDAIDSLNRLGQHLNGLRSGTKLQYDLTKAGMVKNRNKKAKKSTIELDLDASFDDDEETVMLRAAGAMFGELVDDLGPPLKALSTTCTFSLQRLRVAFEHSNSQRQKVDGFRPDDFIELVAGIEKALVRFESTSNHAVLRLYRRSDLVPSSSSSSSRPESVASSLFVSHENLPWNDNEHIFLVYFFLFTLQEFSRELIALVDAMRRIYEYEEDLIQRVPWRKRLYRMIRRMLTRSRTSSRRIQSPPRGARRSFSAYLSTRNRHRFPLFPRVQPHAPDTIQTPPRHKLPLIGRMKQSIWAVGKRLTERDAKYAVKAGMAIAMLAAPAFIDATRPIFVENWGEWALVSCFAVLSPTIGATDWLSLQRALCTFLGAAVAAGIYTLFPEAPVILSIFGFLFSLPCFYLALAHPQYAAASRFILLTYNLTCLYSYNLRQKDIWVGHIAIHRALAVTVGVLWASFVSRFWWPAEARRELSKALGEFCLNMGWLYTRLVASNSFAPEYHPEDGYEENESDSDQDSLIAPPTPTPPQTKLSNSIQEFMAMELHLQIKLIELQGLLAETQNEPRLKGPFPVLLYRGILTSLQVILDRLHSMRCVTTREEWYTSVRREFIVPVNKERREMVGNIILSFSILASAFRLKAPLPPYLPPAEKSRQRLVDAIRKLEVVKKREVKGSRQLLFFAYALTMKGVTEELESLGRTLQTAFGVIGQSAEEFELLFMGPEESRRRIDFAA